MNLQAKTIIPILLLICIRSFGQTDSSDFATLKNVDQWKLVFKDKCTKDWERNWMLDGLFATIENTRKGMHFSAGPEAGNDAHHAVLWTKKSFTGDIKVEYDYTRTDDENRWVNILYLQATGDGEKDFDSDISKWKEYREVPAMRKYFDNMNVLHISYAAFENSGNGTYYVRARRYPRPVEEKFDVTSIPPSYDLQGYFETGKTYHITAIKTGNHLFFKMEHKGEQKVFRWDLSEVAPITEGRIGLRHMYTRSARYRNFKVYSK